MNLRAMISSLGLAAALAPGLVRADSNPDFDDDAKPILRQQPGLLHYVESHFDVKDHGTAKYPGDDDRRPSPPYIFPARPSGSHGAWNLRLLIQPGPLGHILAVVDITKARIGDPDSAPPAVANRPPSHPRPHPSSSATYQSPSLTQPPANPPPVQPATPAPAAQAPTPAPAEPTADTPSGPILGPDSSNSTQPALAPPPDPAPTQ